jgi:hypothetical protein
MRKSQYSVEFLMFFSFLSIIFLIWLVIFSSLNEEAFIEREKLAMDDLGRAIQSHFFVASDAHDGYYSRALFIPSRTGTIPVKVNNTEYVFFIRTSRQDYVYNIPYTVGNLSLGENTLWNIRGVVYISDIKPNITI